MRDCRDTGALMYAPPWTPESVYGAIEAVNSRRSEKLDENDLVILRVTAHLVTEAPWKAEDITLMQEGKEA